MAKEVGKQIKRNLKTKIFLNFERFYLIKVMNSMGHVTKFLLIFRNNSRPHEKRYRSEILGN